jgi:hypothetical protein
MVFRIIRTREGGKVTLRKETSPIVYRSFKIREAAYEEFLRRERTAERRRFTIAAVLALVLFAAIVEGLR